MKDELINKIKNIVLIIYPGIAMLFPKFSNNVLFSILLLLVIYTIIKDKKILFSKYELFLSVFILSIIVSIIFKNINTENDWTMLIRHIRWLLLPFLLANLGIKHKVKYCIYSIVIGVMGYGYRLYQEILSIKDGNISWSIFLKDPLLWNYRYMYRWNIPQSAIILGITSLIMFYIGVKCKEKKIKLLSYFSSFFSFVLMLSTQSRGMLLTFILVLFLVVYILKSKKLAYFFMVFMFIVIGAFFMFRNQNYIHRYENLTKDSSSLARVEVYKEAYTLFKNNKITGVGFEGFRRAQNKNNYKYNEFYWHPHNMALKMLSETGIIGFMAYYAFMFNIIFMLYKNYKKDKICFIGIIAIVTLLLYENIEVIIIKDIALPYIFFIIALCLNQSYTECKVLEEK